LPFEACICHYFSPEKNPIVLACLLGQSIGKVTLERLMGVE